MFGCLVACCSRVAVGDRETSLGSAGQSWRVIADHIHHYQQANQTMTKTFTMILAVTMMKFMMVIICRQHCHKTYSLNQSNHNSACISLMVGASVDIDCMRSWSWNAKTKLLGFSGAVQSSRVPWGPTSKRAAWRNGWPGIKKISSEMEVSPRHRLLKTNNQAALCFWQQTFIPHNVMDDQIFKTKETTKCAAHEHCLCLCLWKCFWHCWAIESDIRR